MTRCESDACTRRATPWRALSAKRQGATFQGRWYCSPDCFERAASAVFAQLVPASGRRVRARHRIPLGLLMYSMGTISQDHLKTALQAQRESGGRFGDCLRQTGKASETQITAALAAQWSCSVYPLDQHLGQHRRFLECAPLIPAPLLEAARMVPVHHLPANRILYVAFAESIDRTALYGVEQMHDCRTEPCFSTESSLDRALEELRLQPRPAEVLFDDVFDPAEMASTVRGYALQLRAEEVRTVSCGEYIWTRITSPGQTTNVLFHVVNMHRSLETQTSAA